jgi:hypothetical protein
MLKRSYRPKFLHYYREAKQHEGPDHFIAPLGLIHEAQLQLGKFRCEFHTHPFHRLCNRRTYVTYQSSSRFMIS